MKPLVIDVPLPKTQAEADRILGAKDFYVDAATETTADRAGSIYYVFNTSGNLGKYLLVPLVDIDRVIGESDKNIRIF
ncbi:MAG: hypothetical protein IKB98_03095 [Clostridia bacterium]|nr:hypothetical protein [Clostridia bacterium]